MDQPQSTAARPDSAGEALDLREIGAARDGVLQTSTRRLYGQLQVLSGARDTGVLVQSLEDHHWVGVLYQDFNQPDRVGLLGFEEDPNALMEKVRVVILADPYASLLRRPELTMTGRTYSTGREADLEDWLLRRPLRYALNPEWPWAIWYPLRRKPEFALLPKAEQGKILGEHAMVGRGYGEKGLAFDIRLSCYGLDQNDNEFVLGLVGSQLFPLSRLVQDMRKTQQTALYIQSLGPFFIGRVLWQSALAV